MSDRTLNFTDIEFDENFTNSRKKIRAKEVSELASNIAKDGLLQPLIVRVVKLEEPETSPSGETITHKYFLISGFKRHAAISLIRTKKRKLYNQIFKDDQISVTAKDCDLVQAQLINLSENVLRSKLSTEEIGQAIVESVLARNEQMIQEKLLPKSERLSLSDVAEYLGKSPNWCQQQCNYYKEASPELKKAVRKGHITLSDGMDIAKAHPNKSEAQMKAAGKLAEVRQKVPGTGKEKRAAANEAVRKTRAELTGKPHKPGSATIRELLVDVEEYENKRSRKALATIFHFFLGEASEKACRSAMETCAAAIEAMDGESPPSE